MEAGVLVEVRTGVKVRLSAGVIVLVRLAVAVRVAVAEGS